MADKFIVQTIENHARRAKNVAYSQKRTLRTVVDERRSVTDIVQARLNLKLNGTRTKLACPRAYRLVPTPQMLRACAVEARQQLGVVCI